LGDSKHGFCQEKLVVKGTEAGLEKLERGGKRLGGEGGADRGKTRGQLEA